MAEINQELAALQHLLEIEKQAASLIDSAKIDADKILSKAHSDYNSAYKARVEELSVQMDADYKKKHDEILEKYKQEVETYKNQYASKPLNKASLFAALEKLLFA